MRSFSYDFGKLFPHTVRYCFSQMRVSTWQLDRSRLTKNFQNFFWVIFLAYSALYCNFFCFFLCFSRKAKAENILTNGIHTFPFSFQLPKDVPSSFEGMAGQRVPVFNQKEKGYDFSCSNSIYQTLVFFHRPNRRFFDAVVPNILFCE